MTNERVPIRSILIAGPTASGKSSLALALARAFDGVVINADASQVYSDLRVLSARPTASEEAQVPHAVYGQVDASESYAVGRWLADVSDVLARSAQPREKRLPIVVGGTGLYFGALTTGLADVPPIPDEIRARWRSAGPDVDLHAELSKRDPAMAARLRPSDPQRLMRALEVIEATGRSLVEWQGDTAPGPVDPSSALRIVLSPPRPWLHERIARRLDVMMEQGAAEEAARLAARELHPSLPAMKALGVAALSAWTRGDLTRDEALERTRLDTRRYAKRQSTWFRNRMEDWTHVSPEDALNAALREIERRGVERG